LGPRRQQTGSGFVERRGGGQTINGGTADGDIRTARSSLATPPGNVTGKLPIYDAGTLLGFIPIYDTIG